MWFSTEVAFSPWMWAVACRVLCRGAVVAPETPIELLQSLHRIEVVPETWTMKCRVSALAPLAWTVFVSARPVVVVLADPLLLLWNSVSYGRIILYLVSYFVHPDGEIGSSAFYAVETRLPTFVVEIVAAVVVRVVVFGAVVIVVAVGVVVGVGVGVV